MILYEASVTLGESVIVVDPILIASQFRRVDRVGGQSWIDGVALQVRRCGRRVGLPACMLGLLTLERPQCHGCDGANRACGTSQPRPLHLLTTAPMLAKFANEGITSALMAVEFSLNGASFVGEEGKLGKYFSPNPGTGD